MSVLIESVIIESNVNNLLVSSIHSDVKDGTWWAIGTEKGWLEIRTTKTGLMRVGEFKKGEHPYFTIKADLSTLSKKEGRDE